MKTFKYQFTKLIKALIYVALILCAVGFGITLYQVIRYGLASAPNPEYKIIQYVLMFAVSVALAVILVSILKNSYYAVDDKYFTTCFGLIKSKFEIEKVQTILLDTKLNKLSVYFKGEIKDGVETEGQFIVIVVNEEWYNDFVTAILKVNPTIEYRISCNEDDK
ncbi:MAG: hypothetical protein E7370_02410 [Clostridiales bacterium]|nr:hypothetical protein [Clostridiales bacterium]